MKFKNVMLLLVSLLVLVACGEGTVNEETTTNQEEAQAVYKKISPKEALAKMSEEGVIIVDVREPSEYADGHVIDAQLLPLGNIKSGDLDMIPDKDQLILLYCRSGNRSGQAGKLLVEYGYTNVFDFGGIMDWPYEVVK